MFPVIQVTQVNATGIKGNPILGRVHEFHTPPNRLTSNAYLSQQPGLVDNQVQAKGNPAETRYIYQHKLPGRF